MDVKLLTALVVLTVVIYPSHAKPLSLVERCYCRSMVNHLPKGYIRELRFIHTPNCPFQVIAKLKTNKEVCVNPEIRWLQQYLKNAINNTYPAARLQLLPMEGTPALRCEHI